MATLQEHKCPCCGGGIGFDTSIQKLKCPYCDTEFDVEQLEAYDSVLQSTAEEDKIEFTTDSDEWLDSVAEGMKLYLCNSCGGEIVGDGQMAATLCPFCGNPVVIMGQYKGDLKPDYVIPFKLDKNAAMAAFSKHLSGKKLLPKPFKDKNHLESLTGVYVPFWLFAATVNANINYQATRVTSWSDSRYEYTQTNNFSVHREGSVSFEKVPVDGSRKVEDKLMESLEPYDYSELTDFRTAHLAGYLAARYDVDSEESKKHATERTKPSAEDAFMATVDGFSSVSTESSHVITTEGKKKYALLPVWFLNTVWEGTNYSFAMNGQTGKFVGNLPLDKAALRRWRWLLFLGFTAGAFLLTVLFYFLTK
ncbi:MAG: hypothetical protein MJ137_08785 [Clostridia bacterium]|nr:hypothetical protein [Clostridia bacterium]